MICFILSENVIFEWKFSILFDGINTFNNEFECGSEYIELYAKRYYIDRYQSGMNSVLFLFYFACGGEKKE